MAKNKRYKINNQDVTKWAKEYDGEMFHALLCDAPYHLTTITKRFGKNGSAPAKFGKDGAFQRVGKGFMGQVWDGNMISFQPETWAALGEHLYPGAFGMTFGGSRTFHKIAMALEDAGMILHPFVSYIFGSGFPKATRVKGHKEFDGHRYGLQALKPAVEPILVWQKPYDGKPIENIVKTGAGALNIDAGRIVRQSSDRFEYGVDGDENQTTGQSGIYGTFKEVSPYNPNPAGRWPANFVIDDVVAPALDAQSGKSKGHIGANGYWGFQSDKGWNKNSVPYKSEGYEQVSDEGGASRFFYNVNTQLDMADPFLYVKKANGKERNAGLNDEPEKSVNDGRKKSIDNAYQRGETLKRNDHPTVKPIDLNRYLASILMPPTDYAPRRILVPFSGVASEMIGALMAGWEYVEGIELGKHYCELGEKRIKHWIK